MQTWMHVLLSTVVVTGTVHVRAFKVLKLIGVYNNGRCTFASLFDTLYCSLQCVLSSQRQGDIQENVRDV